jgi:predicted aspartyl protease
MKKTCFLLTICLLAAVAGAQAQRKRPPLLTTIPFEQLYGGVMLVRAQVGNSADTLNFILDTGSGGISLDSLTAARLGVRVTYTNQTVSGIGGTRKINLAENLKLKLPGITIDSLTFSVNRYDVLTEAYGVNIDGIIGYAFISRFILEVNFDQGKIDVYEKGPFRYPRGGWLWKYRLVYLPNTTLEVRDSRTIFGQYYIDTGAGLCMLFSEEMAADSGLLVSGKTPLVTQVDGMGGKATTRITTLKFMRLGPYKFKNVPIYLYNDEGNVLQYPAASGLIGNDILRRFNWVMNYSEKELHLTPNKSFTEPFDYAYTGLGIYLIDDEVKVTDVVKDSPGEKAGFQVGDVIFSVDHIVSKNVSRIKSLLHDAKRNLKVIVFREGKPLELTMRVMSIL